MPSIVCQRCGAELAPDRLDLEGWLARHAYDDGLTLFVCPRCQRSDERRIVAEVRERS